MPPTAAWTRVSRNRGAAPDPAVNAISQINTTIGRTIRSSVMLIGAWNVSWIRSKGVNQIIAMSTATDHGNSAGRPGPVAQCPVGQA